MSRLTRDPQTYRAFTHFNALEKIAHRRTHGFTALLKMGERFENGKLRRKSLAQKGGRKSLYGVGGFVHGANRVAFQIRQECGEQTYGRKERADEIYEANAGQVRQFAENSGAQAGHAKRESEEKT